MYEVATTVLCQLFRSLDELWGCVRLFERDLLGHKLVIPLKPGKPIIYLFEI